MRGIGRDVRHVGRRRARVALPGYRFRPNRTMTRLWRRPRMIQAARPAAAPPSRGRRWRRPPFPRRSTAPPRRPPAGSAERRSSNPPAPPRRRPRRPRSAPRPTAWRPPRSGPARRLPPRRDPRPRAAPQTFGIPGRHRLPAPGRPRTRHRPRADQPASHHAGPHRGSCADNARRRLRHSGGRLAGGSEAARPRARRPAPSTRVARRRAPLAGISLADDPRPPAAASSGLLELPGGLLADVLA